MGFPRQEYQSGLPFPSPEDLPDPGVEPVSPASPALAGGFFSTGPSGKPVPVSPGVWNTPRKGVQGTPCFFLMIVAHMKFMFKNR